jgi:uncharacterized membrane protein YjgN (DUF898 family)
MDEAVTAVPVISPTRIAFSGNRSDFRRLAIRGAALELITVGFYRFWLATDIRRHLWSNTSVERDAPEYTGTAKELLIGFLFALAILVPIYLVYFLIGLEAERLQAFASIPLILFFYLFAQFAIYRARRYRLTRTVWRGVRFWMAGSGSNYAWRVGLWSLLVILTIGLALPWRQAALERFKMGYTSYGGLAGRFEGSGWEFFKRGWWLWLLAILALIFPLAVAVVPAAGFFLPLTPIAWPFIYAVFKAIEWRWWVSGIRLGDVSFDSDLTNGALIGLYWKVVGWGVLFVFALMIWIAAVLGIAVALSDVAATTQGKILVVSQRPAVLVAIGVGYLVVVLAVWAVMRLYLIRDVWQRVAASTTIHNLAAADDVTARGHAVSALGEGFADSLDIGGL